MIDYQILGLVFLYVFNAVLYARWTWWLSIPWAIMALIFLCFTFPKNKSGAKPRKEEKFTQEKPDL
jgi:preprotein translocase subunit SecG